MSWLLFYTGFGIYHSLTDTYFYGMDRYLGTFYFPIIKGIYLLIKNTQIAQIHPEFELRSFIKSNYYSLEYDRSTLKKKLEEKYGNYREREVAKFLSVTDY